MHDVPAHFSNLKKFALSPAHYLASLGGGETTRAMRIGTVVHHLVLGPHRTRPLVRYEGEARRGKDWERCVTDAPPNAEIVTAPEWAEAKVIADAVVADPVANGILLGCRREVSLTWDDAGIACATDGIDFVGPDYIGDLKTTTCTEPAEFSRHAIKLNYHAQLAWLESGAKANGISTAGGMYLVGVETSPPYAVTVLRMTPDVIDLGRKSVTMWLEKLRSCRENSHWPAYTQTVVDFLLPPWIGEGEADADEA
jgi:hypothetical protein